MKNIISLARIAIVIALGIGLISCAGTKSDVETQSENGSPSPAEKTLDKPDATGNTKIDNFVEDGFKLLAEVQEMKKNFAEANETLNSINAHPIGPVDWMKDELASGVSNSKNSLSSGEVVDPTAAVKEKLSDLLNVSKETMSSLESLLSHTEALLKALPEMPAEAKTLGMKAPKALKAIKSTGNAIKAVPEELKAAGAEGELVIAGIEELLSSIGN
ncbi:hypothetical protein HQ531_14105 [bacterium]|nr:hypothetical protein [bacterium]